MKITLVIITITLGFIAWPLTLMLYWSWFLTPTLSVPEISYAQSIGFYLFIALVKYRKKEPVEPSTDNLIKDISSILAVNIMYLVVGFVMQLILPL